MGYHRPGHKDLHQEIKEQLRAKERFGASKYADKKAGIAKDGIYSYNTAKAYNRDCQRFARYVSEHSPQGRYTSLADAKPYAVEYIQSLNADKFISAYTVKARAAALGKLYGCSAKEFGSTNSRYRADITRSRNRTVVSEKTGKTISNQRTNAGHFSEKKNAEIVSFARGTGLRRSELSSLRGTQLVECNGAYFLDVTGKGGRERLAPIIGDVKEIVERCRAAGNGKVWEKIPTHMDVHHYRSQYATNLYRSLAREPGQIPKSEKYCCRKDLAGTHYDKIAMLKVSQALGHNRISVIAEHYLR